MPSPQIERKLAAIMFTDIAGYTAQMSKDEAVAISLLNKKESVLKPLIAKHNGTYVKSTGDGSLSHFNSAVDAATCAKRLQESIYDDKDLNVRVGVHLGDTIFEKGDIRGDGVNIASRLESMAVEGGVFVSKEVHDQLVNQKEFEGVSLGLQSMKGVGRLIEVYGLKGDKLSEPNPKDYKENYCPCCDSNKEVPSIAIIPFRNKGKKKDEYYAYGICAELISDCSSAGLIRVASLEQVEELGDLTVKEKAKKLDVRYIATGALWRMDDMFHLSIELYDSKEAEVIWSDNWQENWANLPMIKGSLSDGILKVLDITSKLEKKADTFNTEAYEYFLKAKYKWEMRRNMVDNEVVKGLLQKAIELDDYLIVAKNLLGRMYTVIGEKNKGLDIFKQNLKQAERLEDKKGIAISLRSIGNFYHMEGDYEKDLKYQNLSLNICEEIGDKYGIAAALNNIGIVYSHRGNYDKELFFHKRSLKIKNEIGDKFGIAATFANIGALHRNKEDYSLALDFFNKGLDISNNISSYSMTAHLILNIGGLYFEMFDCEKALKHLKRALEMYNNIGTTSRIIPIYGDIGKLYKLMGNFDKSLVYYNQELTVLKATNDSCCIGNSLSNLAIIYYHKGDYEKTIEYFEESFSFTEYNSGIDDIIYLYLAYKHLGREYDVKEIHTLIKEAENIEFELNLRLYQLLDDKSHLESAYNQVQEKASAMEDELSNKFLSYPIPKAIVEEWEKVK